MAQRLETLGFTVLNLDRPEWTRDEIILACALAESNDWRQVYDTDPRAKELSELLQSPAIHPLPRHPDFRNPAGVGQKTRNIVDQHPDHRGPRSNGNRLDKEVLDDFLADPVGMRAMAARIRELFATADADSTELPDLDPVDIPAGEGGVALRAHLRRERDPKLRPASSLTPKPGPSDRMRGVQLRFRSDVRCAWPGLHRMPPPHSASRHRRDPDQAGRPGAAVLELPSDDPPHQAMADSRRTEGPR